eukprot:CAMPEP_0197936850 /NCGR_PEP_ID=MMETSP1439-20131203/115593_1 /TAXON_ID=66791 /ORGANISM="Gonyaulax spinifera, Strain CCMP409" /LENGTH=34 /DNA_ID= /DNA_START= /DNA_END= /DNA_ORIENTATION=
MSHSTDAVAMSAEEMQAALHGAHTCLDDAVEEEV